MSIARRYRAAHQRRDRIEGSVQMQHWCQSEKLWLLTAALLSRRCPSPMREARALVDTVTLQQAMAAMRSLRIAQPLPHRDSAGQASTHLGNDPDSCRARP